MPEMREVDDVALRQLTGIILIEGVDGTGKTTLARTLQQVSSHRALLHAGPPKTTSAFTEYVKPLEMAYDGWTIICDRWHLGELVWPAIFERESLFSSERSALSFRWIEEHIKAIGVPVTAIYLTRALDEIINELDWREDPRDNVEPALKLYETACDYSSFDWNRIDLMEVLDGKPLRVSR
jgi:hypothetical protein